MKKANILKTVFILLGINMFISCKTDVPKKEIAADEKVADDGVALFTEPLGIAPYTFRRSFPNGIAATLDTIQGMGFTSIEGNNGGVTAKEFKKLCNERGLSIPSIGGSYEELLNNPQQVIADAKIFGAKYIMCAWIPHNTGSFSFEDAKKAAKDFNTIGKKLKENGLTLSYHAHGYELVKHEGGTLLDYLMKNTNPDYVSFEMDIYWIQFGGGNPAYLLRKYPNRWKMMHLKDLRKGTLKDHTGLTDPDNDVTLGQGELDIKGIIEAAKEIGIEHYFIEDESERIIEQIPASIAYLRGLKE